MQVILFLFFWFGFCRKSLRQFNHFFQGVKNHFQEGKSVQICTILGIYFKICIFYSRYCQNFQFLVVKIIKFMGKNWQNFHFWRVKSIKFVNTFWCKNFPQSHFLAHTPYLREGSKRFKLDFLFIKHIILILDQYPYKI